MEIGFAKTDITPRVGVELCGFGPFLNRHSTAIRDRLWARAMVVRVGDRTAVILSCDLVGVAPSTTQRVRQRLAASHGLPPEAVMLCCSHTHSGPAVGVYTGWGAADPPYIESLPYRISAAATAALSKLQPASLYHAEVPCEGIGVNREYDRDAPPLDEVLAEDWRPDKPHLTDTSCHVLSARNRADETIGFVSYFGCHPVVCCQANHAIHGDFPGIATNQVERDFNGAVGLFLQGAQGDVNSGVVHKPEQESLLALDVIAGRYARSLRHGLRAASPIKVSHLRFTRRDAVFTRKAWSPAELRRRLDACENAIGAEDKAGGWSDASNERRMQTVYAIALRNLLQQAEQGATLSPPKELHGMRLGPIALLGSPFETFQAIKNDVTAAAQAPIPLVTSFVNESAGYAADKTCAQRGGYAADMVPLIRGELPFASIHDELVRELLATDAILAQNE